MQVMVIVFVGAMLARYDYINDEQQKVVNKRVFRERYI